MLAAFPDARLLHSAELQGPGGSRNFLIEAAAHELVANFDDDSFPEHTEYFARVWETAKRFPTVAIFSAINHDDPLPASCYTRISVASGCGCVFRKSWYQKVGGFVPLPIAYNMEEVDMGLRLMAVGGVILCDSKLKVIHDKPPVSHVTPETNAAILANTALFPFLRYPVWLWPLGMWQVVHRLLFLLSKGWLKGMGHGLSMIPRHLQKYSYCRREVSSINILAWILLGRFPRPIHHPTERTQT